MSIDTMWHIANAVWQQFKCNHDLVMTSSSSSAIVRQWCLLCWWNTVNAMLSSLCTVCNWFISQLVDMWSSLSLIRMSLKEWCWSCRLRSTVCKVRYQHCRCYCCCKLCFAVAGAKIWNSLSVNLHLLSQSLHTFGHKLKHCLFVSEPWAHLRFFKFALYKFSHYYLYYYL